MELNHIVQATLYAIEGALIFHWLRYRLKLSIFICLILGMSLFHTVFCLTQNAAFSAWFSEYLWAIIDLGSLVTLIVFFSKNNE